MRPDRTVRASPVARPRRPWRAIRAAGAEPLRSWRQPAPTLALVLLVAALLAPPTALALAATAGTTVAGPAPTAAAGHAGRVPPLSPPVGGPLVRGYEEPAGRFGPGHRGVDLAGIPGAAVLAPAAGRVVFAGGVAGTMWVSIEVAPGVVITLGPLRALAVATGHRVATRTRVADLAPGHGSAEHPTTLHLGLRVDGIYVDPFPWLTGFGRPRLAPLLEPGGPH